MARISCALAALVALAFALVPGVAAAPSTSPTPTQWTVNGANGATVRAIQPFGDQVAIGGSFSYLGPRTGSGIATDPATGDRLPDRAVFGDEVTAAIGDGAGGLYVGGRFRDVGGSGQDYLVHLDASGAVVPRFAPAPDGPVADLALRGGSLYATGAFTAAGGAARPGIVRLSRTTGAADEGFDAAAQGPVSDVEVARDGAVYAAGAFAGGSLAQLSTTGVEGLTWDLDDPSVSDLALSSDGASLYVSGSFGTIAPHGAPAVARTGVARVATAGGQVAEWDPAPSGGPVADIELSGDDVYLAGGFQALAGGALARNGFAKLAAGAQATVADWDPKVSGSLDPTGARGRGSLVRADGDSVYLSGTFTQVGEAERHAAARVDGATAAAATWDPDLSDPAAAIVAGRSAVFVGGSFVAARGVLRRDVAVLDAAGVPTAFDAKLEPGPDSTGVHALAHAPEDGGTLWLGGRFTSVGGAARTSLAALDPATGTARPADPRLSDGASVAALVADPSSGRLYVGGAFAGADGAATPNLAVIERATGRRKGFTAAPDGAVEHLVLSSDGRTLYAAGAFTQIGSGRVQSRNGIAGLRTSTGAATPMTVEHDGSIEALALLPGDATLLFGGDARMTTVGGQPRAGMAAVETTTGAVATLDANVDGPVTAITVSPDGQSVLVGGSFTHAGDALRPGFVEIDALTGARRERILPFGGEGAEVETLAATGGPAGSGWWVGGSLTSPLDGGAQRGFVQIRQAAPEGLDTRFHVLAPGVTADGTTATVTWKPPTGADRPAARYGVLIETLRPCPEGSKGVGCGPDERVETGSAPFVIDGLACSTGYAIGVDVVDADGKRGPIWHFPAYTAPCAGASPGRPAPVQPVPAPALPTPPVAPTPAEPAPAGPSTPTSPAQPSAPSRPTAPAPASPAPAPVEPAPAQPSAPSPATPGTVKTVSVTGYRAPTPIHHAPETPGYSGWVGAWVDGSSRINLAFADLTQGNGIAASRDFGGTLGASVMMRAATAAPTAAGDFGVSRSDPYGDPPLSPAPHAYSGQATIGLRDGGTLRRVNGEDIPGCTAKTVRCSAYLQRLAPGGGAWSSPVTFPWLPPTTHTYQVSRLRYLSDGRLLASGNFWKVPAGTRGGASPKPVNQWLLAVSSDDGRTWSNALEVPSANAAPANEWDTVELSGGRLLGMLRTQTAAGATVRRQVLLTPNAKGWTMGAPTAPKVGHLGHPELFRTAEGVILHVARGTSPSVHWSTDEGASWQPLDLPAARDRSGPYYARAVQVGGRIYLFGHSGVDNPRGVDSSILMESFELKVG